MPSISNDTIPFATNTQLIHKDSNFIADSNLVIAPIVTDTIRIEAGYEGTPHPYHTNTAIFYSLLAVLLILGVFRYSNELFYKNLFRSFISTNNSFRHVKAQVGQYPLINTLMSIVFFIIAGVYIYYIIQVFRPDTTLLSRSPLLNIATFSLGLLLIYCLKLGFLKLLGNLFEIEEYTEEYIFNILLINKIISIVLVPILCIMVFANTGLAKIITILSFIIIGLAILNRYARSRESMSKLLKVNKFHFFIYLCASEILPFAILGKFILTSA